MLERWTLRVLISAIMNGAVQDCRSSSNSGLLPRGCFGPVNPGVSANGSFRIATRLRSLATASNVALALAAVPPESVPRMSRTRPLTRAAGAPNTRLASSCTKNAPSSNGTESKPQENTMRAPLPWPPPRARRSSAASRPARRRDRNSPCRSRAGREQFGAIELIRADRGDHRPGLVHHRLQRGRIAGVGDDQRRIGRRADRVAHGRRACPGCARPSPISDRGRPCNARRDIRRRAGR